MLDSPTNSSWHSAALDTRAKTSSVFAKETFWPMFGECFLVRERRSSNARGAKPFVRFSIRNFQNSVLPIGTSATTTVSEITSLGSPEKEVWSIGCSARDTESPLKSLRNHTPLLKSPSLMRFEG